MSGIDKLADAIVGDGGKKAVPEEVVPCHPQFKCNPDFDCTSPFSCETLFTGCVRWFTTH